MSAQPTDQPARPRSVFAARDQPPAPPAVSDNPFSKGYWTEERRQEQREKMLALRANGMTGGRKRAKKAQEIVAEHYQEQAEVIIAKLDGMLSQNRSRELQLAAIDRIFRAEEWATKNARDEERHFKDMGESELEQYLIGMVGEALGLDLSLGEGDVVDGTVVEDDYDPMERQLGGDALREAVAEREEEDDVGDSA
jgi:hypothetical protein